MRTRHVASCWLTVAGALCALVARATPQIPDRSVYGRWSFNGGSLAASADESGWGGTAFTLGAGVSYVANGSYDGSGYLNVATAGATATATLGGGNSVGSSAYQTVFARYKSNCTMSTSGASGEEYQNELAYVNLINDHDNWHHITFRYQATLLTYKQSYNSAIDPTSRPWFDVKPRAELSTKYTVRIPASVSGSTVSVGGMIGQTDFEATRTAYAGLVDDVVVMGRQMSLHELARYCQTGETFVYHESTPSFAAYNGWASEENKWRPAPGDMTGAAYIVDGGETLTQNATATFGGNVDKRISLTLGRLMPLTNQLDNTVLVANTQGKFSQGAGTAITFYDLRLNDGTITALGTSLTTTLLDVDAPAAKPFALLADGDFALNAAQATTGSGVLAKTGAGKLTVSQWSGTAKLRLAAGSVKTPRLDGYTGGKVLVDTTANTVAFTGTDARPTAQKKMQLLFDGAKPTAKTAVMTVPDGVTAEMIEDTTVYELNKVGVVSVEGGTVYVTPGYAEDQGVPVILMGE